MPRPKPTDLQAVVERLDEITTLLQSQQQPQRMAFRPQEVSAMVNLSLPLIYNEIRAGRLRSRRINNSYLISTAAIEEWLNSETA